MYFKPGITTSKRSIAISAVSGQTSNLSELYTSNVYPDYNEYISTKRILEQERKQLMKELFNV